MRVLSVAAALVVGAAVLGPHPNQGPTSRPAVQFDHEKHARLFPTCAACHGGVREAGGSIYPEPTLCGACHDGTIQPRVDWRPPTEPRATNLRFDHVRHPAIDCTNCHQETDAPWMSVRRAVVPRCLGCHGGREPHYAATDRDCSLCHLPLPEAVRLTAAAVARFPVPPSHRDPEWRTRGGHGLLAYRPVETPAPAGVAVSCATCHARDFCVQCHVDAPEQSAIQALQPDPRSLVFQATLEAPASHRDPDFLGRHGEPVQRSPVECRTCHTRESCVECHAATAEVARGIFPAGPGRGVGAVVRRTAPPSHWGGFRDRHAPVAAASPQTCAGCHVRGDCLECHRPNAASGAPGYHPAEFLSRHPAAAYARENSCSDCHNPGGFCADCHQSAGLAARRPLGSGYHDGKQFFLFGHGQAARQNLESCVACHTERDCLRCHSAVGGRRFNPHGPDFDAERLRRRNSQVCTVCHGAAVPRAP